MGWLLTPNLTRLSGFFRNQKSYKFPLYNELALRLTDNLEEIYVHFQDGNDNSQLIQGLGKFENLKKITITGDLNDAHLTDLDRMLNAHNQHDSLYIYELSDKDIDMKDWLANHQIKKLPSLDFLHIKEADTQLLEYLVAKFDQIKVVYFDIDILSPYDSRIIKRYTDVLDILKNIPKLTFKFFDFYGVYKEGFNVKEHVFEHIKDFDFKIWTSEKKPLQNLQVNQVIFL
ncbi:hypothetical protein [Parasitella parasitica]|uniref:Uncharacterized protein n=1 Tax=Parasitella parasitica TaxID=35722 RepID=A0A0B7NKA0_9FUNG|nr:hypothetical protein [Parasitella parasitica]